MKKILVLVVISYLMTIRATAQVQEQKVLLLQIAALKVYIEFAQKGYNVVKKGLDFIGDLKKGELNLHKDYFSSLQKVNPKIKKYVKVAEIILMQIKIIREYKTAFRALHADDLFYGDELDYIERCFNRLLESCDATLKELLTVTSDSNLEMKDDQRIERIDGLHLKMMDDYTFCETFCKELRKKSLAKAKEHNDVNMGRLLNGL
jgi:hypothetical protein